MIFALKIIAKGFLGIDYIGPSLKKNKSTRYLPKLNQRVMSHTHSQTHTTPKVVLGRLGTTLYSADLDYLFETNMM